MHAPVAVGQRTAQVVDRLVLVAGIEVADAAQQCRGDDIALTTNNPIVLNNLVGPLASLVGAAQLMQGKASHTVHVAAAVQHLSEGLGGGCGVK